MPALAALVVAIAVAAGLIGLAPRYRRDLAAARTRLDAVRRAVVQTDHGPVEYAERDTGQPLLVSHGIFHGCDGGLLSARDVVVGRRVVAPSRFGYLGSAMPSGATTADQADAFVSLLDHLGIDRADALGISAGTGAAVQLALRHPDRVAHLVVISGNWPGSPTAQAPPGWAKAFYSDRAMWTLKTLAPATLGRLMGVPRGFAADADDSRRIARMLDSIFPLGPRRRGAIFDAYVANPEINAVALEDVRVPTLIVHAQDDPLASHNAAVDAAERIPTARLLSLESGGHLGLGQAERIRAEVAAFLGGPARPPGSA